MQVEHTVKRARDNARGTVFAWQTREFNVDDITAALNGLYKAAPLPQEFQGAGQASSHQHSSSSLAQRCRFSIARPSIRGTRTSLRGAGPAETMAGTRIVKAPNNADATIRLQTFRRALVIFLFFRIPCWTFTARSSKKPTCDSSPACYCIANSTCIPFIPCST